jgi:hypothetical protein
MITRFSAPPSISKSAHFNMKRQSRPVSNGASAVSAGNVPNREGISNFEIPNSSCENPADRPVPWMLKDAHLAGPLLRSSAAALIVLCSLLARANTERFSTHSDRFQA